MNSPPAPRALRIVVAVCFAQGAVAVANMLFGVGPHLNVIDVSVLWLFVGFGLRARRPGWRICAVVLFALQQAISLLALAVIVVFAFDAFASDSPPFGYSLSRPAWAGAALLACMMFALAKWCGRALDRAGVRAWFAPARAEGTAAAP
jgi:hypothetical protein